MAIGFGPHVIVPGFRKCVPKSGLAFYILVMQGIVVVVGVF